MTAAKLQSAVPGSCLSVRYSYVKANLQTHVECMWFHFSWVCSFSSVFSTNVQAAEHGLLTSQLMLILNHAI